VDANSVFGIIDGNPRAATGFLAEDAYFRWGQDSSIERLPREPAERAASLDQVLELWQQSGTGAHNRRAASSRRRHDLEYISSLHITGPNAHETGANQQRNNPTHNAPFHTAIARPMGPPV
jgi:hypothetical protein